MKEFKNQYNSYIESESPSEDSVEKLRANMSAERSSPAPAVAEPTAKRASMRRRNLRALTATAACLLIATAILIPSLLTGGGGIIDVVKDDVSSYGELYNRLLSIKKSGSDHYYGRGNFNEDIVLDGAISAGKDALPPSYSPAPGNSSQTSETSHSDVNVQVKGVNEADVARTDGKYIYSVSGTVLSVVPVNNGKFGTPVTVNLYESLYDDINAMLESFSVNTVSSDGKNDSQFNIYSFEFYLNTCELYVSNARVIVISSVTKYTAVNYYQLTSATVVDLTDINKPEIIESYTQSGGYITSRMIGNTLYLVTNYYASMTDAKGASAEDQPYYYVPMAFENNDGGVIGLNDITVNTDGKNSVYLVVSGIDTDAATKRTDIEAYLGYGYNVYCNAEKMFVVSSQYETQGNLYCNMTSILSLSLNDGEIEKIASGKVKGAILNQFSMDEYDGVFRIVTTIDSYEMSGSVIGGDLRWNGTIFGSNKCNALYTLDEDLNIIGQIGNLAPDERVYSVRFEGEIGYFVTYRQTDPLFTVDLSDPRTPVILSELKIPGFSNYLHPFTDGRLFGLGVSENGYIKLSMFDTSDKTDVTEKHKYEIKSCYYTEASYNHKAIMIETGKRTFIGFPGNSDNSYYMFGYDDEKGFYEIASLINNDGFYSSRGMYVGDYLYICSPGYGMSSFDLNAMFDLLQLGKYGFAIDKFDSIIFDNNSADSGDSKIGDPIMYD